MTKTKTKIACEKCHGEFPKEELTEFGGVMVCSQCFSNETLVCDCCHERLWADDNNGDDGLVLCLNCRETQYYRCSDCNRIIYADDVRFSGDDTPYCSECYNEQNDENNDEDLYYINPYHYKPAPIFHGEGIFYGIELELDDGGMNDSNALKILDIGNQSSSNIYIKQDGSLDDGMEIVTHPSSLEYIQSEMPWKEIFKSAIHMGYRSHQAETCGLHCHISRDALGCDDQEQEKTISNILFFVEKNWDQMLRFSRRTESQINRWASRYGMKNSPKELMEHAKNNSIGRYACVNLENSATIEIRMFRGTLKYQTFIATIQLVDEICQSAISLSENEMKSLSWQDFVLGISKESKPELIEYLKLRQLYVNEPIENESEDI